MTNRLYQVGQVVAIAGTPITRFVRIERFSKWQNVSGAEVMASDTECEWVPLINLRPLSRQEKEGNNESLARAAK